MILPSVSIQNFSCISGFAEGMLKDAKRQMVISIEVEKLVTAKVRESRTLQNKSILAKNKQLSRSAIARSQRKNKQQFKIDDRLTYVLLQ